jgi:hypothetical protein
VCLSYCDDLLFNTSEGVSEASRAHSRPHIHTDNEFIMSGIEVAGIVLGAIPLVISGLEHYGEGARTIRSMWDYPKEFATLSRRLRVENETFRNTMELVLSGFVGDGTLSDMLTQPGGQAWTETRIEQELHRTLQGSHAVFLETVVDMNRALVTFMERLRLDTDGKVSLVKVCAFSACYVDRQTGPIQQPQIVP